MRLDAFLLFEGGGPEGESTDALHEKEIEILHFEQSAERLRKKAVGDSAGARMYDLSTVRIVKPLDKTSPRLLEAVTSQKLFKKAKISACRWLGASKDSEDKWKKIDYFRIELTDVYVSRLLLLGDPRVRSFGGDGVHHYYPEDLAAIGPLEEVELNYQSLKWQYMGPDGTKGVISIPIKKN